MNINNKQYQAVQELYELIKRYNMCFGSDDPYCGVEVTFNSEETDYLVISAEEKSIANWLEAYEEFA